MKIEHLLVQYLYKNKSVSLRDIGTFAMNSNINFTADTDKDVPLPADAIQFVYDAKAENDPGFIDYIIEKTRKIRPLATSDLDSFVSLNKQVLNIGKPLEIEGLGTLQKIGNGVYEFVQAGNFRIKAEVPVVEIKDRINRDISFSAKPKARKNSPVAALTIGGIVLAGLIGAGIYYFYNYRKNHTEGPVTEVLLDTSANKKNIRKDTTIATQPVQPSSMPANAGSFKVQVYEYTSKERGEASVAKLRSYGHRSIELVTSDSVTYRSVLTFNNPIGDSTRILDSLKRTFPKARILH